MSLFGYEELEETLTEIQDKKDQIKRLTEEIENLFASLPQANIPDNYPAGRWILKVRENRRFNEAQAARVLDEETYNSIQKLKVDSTLARRKLSGEEYEACQTVVGLVRNIEEVTDENE